MKFEVVTFQWSALQVLQISADLVNYLLSKFIGITQLKNNSTLLKITYLFQSATRNSLAICSSQLPEIADVFESATRNLSMKMKQGFLNVNMLTNQ